NDLVAPFDCFRQRAAADFGDVCSAVLLEVGSVTAVGRLGSGGGNGQTAGDRFQAAATSTAAQWTFGHHLDVADLHARRFRTAKDLSFVNAAAANARAGEDANHAPRSLAGAEPVFRIDAGIDVVQDGDGAAEMLLQLATDGDIAPGQVGWIQHHASL